MIYIKAVISIAPLGCLLYKHSWGKKMNYMCMICIYTPSYICLTIPLGDLKHFFL